MKEPAPSPQPAHMDQSCHAELLSHTIAAHSPARRERSLCTPSAPLPPCPSLSLFLLLSPSPDLSLGDIGRQELSDGQSAQPCWGSQSSVCCPQGRISGPSLSQPQIRPKPLSASDPAPALVSVGPRPNLSLCTSLSSNHSPNLSIYLLLHPRLSPRQECLRSNIHHLE